MQNTVLEENPTADIRVYVVWEPMLPTDAFRMTRSGLVHDKRATHYKDDQQISGKWFSETFGAAGVSPPSVAWDIAYVFGPEATWEEEPGPMLASGAAVIHKAKELMEAITPLLSKE